MANTVLLEARSYRPFKSSEEYLYAMREDLAEWLNTLYPDLRINVDNFMDRLDTGVVLCKHSNNVRQAAEEYLIRRQARKSMTKSMTSGLAGPILAMGNVHFLPAAKSGTFFARDNVSNFITWCRKSLQIFECLLFETDDLIMRKNEKHVILCLLEVARRGAKFGMLAPMLVQMERQIDREIAADNKANCIDMSAQTDNMNESIGALSVADNMYDSDSEDDNETVQTMLVYGPQPQVVTNDLRSLDEMVRELVANCTCPSQFPMVRLSGGKYRIGDTKVLIFVRILRSHVMVRVGGGWDTLSHYLDKHDPCRCRSQHRSAVGARLITRTNQTNNGIELNKAQVHYDRSPQQSKAKVVNFSADTPKSPIHGVQSSVENARNQSPIHSKCDEQSLSPISRRSLSPYQQHQQRCDQKTKFQHSGTNINALINEIESIKWLDDDASTATGQTNSTSSNEIDSKYENASDNGSEISDEGYRSLGVTQQANGSSSNKQLLSSANGKTHSDGVEEDVKMETTLNTDSRSVTAENSPIEPLHNNEQFPTDSTASTAMKTGDTIIGIDSPKKQSPSRIPRSPMPSRRSPIVNSVSSTITGLPSFSRQIPAYRSVRKSAEMVSTMPATNISANPSTKIGTPKLMRRNAEKSIDDEPDHSIGKTPKNSQQNLRCTQAKHGSPKKGIASPLAREILEVTASAENDAQMLTKMKQLLSKYKMSSPLNDPSNRQPSNASQFDDDLTMEFNSLNLYQPPVNSLRKTRSNSVISSRDNIAFGGKMDVLIADRPVRGTTRIPAPIRQNTELY